MCAWRSLIFRNSHILACCHVVFRQTWTPQWSTLKPTTAVSEATLMASNPADDVTPDVETIVVSIVVDVPATSARSVFGSDSLDIDL